MIFTGRIHKFGDHVDTDIIIPATLLSNTDPSPSTDAGLLKQRLLQQMTTGVRWRETMEQFGREGIDEVVEIGHRLGGFVAIPFVIAAVNLHDHRRFVAFLPADWQEKRALAGFTARELPG